MKRSIEIIVFETGDIRIDAVGFQGADCESATKYLEEALGVVRQREKKPEYHRSRSVHQKQRLGS